MTPSDIAANIGTLKPQATDITQTVTGTPSFVGGNLTIDDAGSWG